MIGDEIHGEALSFGQIRLTFPEEGFSVDVTCADAEVNPLYAAASMHYLSPVKLAAQIGRLSEDRSEALLASCYARGGVIVGSPTEGLCDFGEDEWEHWLLQDRERFSIIRSYCEVRSNFNPNARADDGDRSTGSAAGAGQ